MSDLAFEWDSVKEKLNWLKHGVSFEEAVTVFDDPEAYEYFDPESPPDEDRFLIVGMSKQPRLLVVCHCERENGGIIRIISARKATKREAREYGTKT